MFFVDEGRVKDVSIIKLFELPPHLKSYPFQVCIKEMDIDTSTANKYKKKIMKTGHWFK